MKSITFLLVANIRGMSFNPAAKKGFKLRRVGKESVTISLKPNDPKEDPYGHVKGLTCRVVRSYPASKFQCDFVDALTTGIFLPYPGCKISLPHKGKDGRLLIDSAGKIQSGYLLSHNHYPLDLQSLASTSFKELNEEAQRLLRLLMWFFDTRESHSPLEYASLYWKVTGKDYHVVKLPGHSFSAKALGGVAWRDGNEKAFGKLWRRPINQPLAHELLQEAISLIHNAPRSALLMLASALETGVKNYLSQRLPPAEWLLSEVPSPPIFKMLRDYLSTLPTSSQLPLTEWLKLKPMFSRIQKRIEDRNHLTHRGQMTVSHDDLVTFSDDVTDLLYVFDALNGQDWARQNIRSETCRNLGWPAAVPLRSIGMITVHSRDE